MSSVAARARRHQLIVSLVQARPFASQEALAAALAARGHRVAQSTLSRDLKELRIVRVPDAAGYRYLPAGEGETAGSPAPALAGLAAVEVVGVTANEVAVVLRTQVGHAQGVAVYVDGLRLPGILATVAGDDTVLVLPTSVELVADVTHRLRQLFALRSEDEDQTNTRGVER